VLDRNVQQKGKIAAACVQHRISSVKVQSVPAPPENFEREYNNEYACMPDDTSFSRASKNLIEQPEPICDAAASMSDDDKEARTSPPTSFCQRMM
jgi:hypothetical protein